MGEDNMRCVEICTKDGKKKRVCPTENGKGLKEEEMGAC